MKHTMTTYLLTSSLAIYFLLQNTAAMASSTDHDSFSVTGAPVLLAEAGNDRADENRKPRPGQADPRDHRPLEPAIRNSVRDMVSTSHKGLVEENTGKGVEMKLKGRFRTAPVAIINDDGSVTVRDYSAAPPAE